MKRLLLALTAMCAIQPALVYAQVQGFRIDAGPVFLTKSGHFVLGSGEIESDAGVAIRGRVRYGFGRVSVAADAESSSQEYGRPARPGAPDNLNATFLGVTGAVHPFKIAGIAPYAEIGLGKLFFADEKISTESGLKASSYGLGVVFGGESRLALDLGLRLMRQTGLTVRGVAGDFKYDPKLFSALLSIRL